MWQKRRERLTPITTFFLLIFYYIAYKLHKKLLQIYKLYLLHLYKHYYYYDILLTI